MPNQPTAPSSEKKPLISFIVTCYNLPEELLSSCIESITALSLTQDEREIIVIDDGSAVSPLPALEKHLDEITYIRQTNQGLSAARNIGIATSKGQYLQFVDGDDQLNPPVYDQCLDIVRSHTPDLVLFEQSGKAEESTAASFDGPTEGSTYMRHHNLRASACGYLFLKSLLIDLRFTPGILHEDEEFTPRLILRAERLYHTVAKAYIYRKREQSITTATDSQWLQRRLSDLRGILFRMADQTDALPIEEREALERRVSQLTMDYVYNIIHLTHDPNYLERCIAQLTERGLFPLPNRNYTRKYQWFRRMTSTRWRRRLLCLLLR